MHRLELAPPPFLTLSLYFSCGFDHSAALDANSTIWIFKAWGCPIQLVSPSLDCSSPETTPIQAECGPLYCAVLTRSGDVYAWWTNSDPFERLYLEAVMPWARPAKTVIPCQTKELKLNPIKLPALPDLPDLPDTGLSGEDRGKETRLIKIAAGDGLIGLTNKGHVLRLDLMDSEDDTWIWYYVSENVRALVPCLSCGVQLPHYSEVGKVKKIPAFRPTTGDDGQKRPPQVELLSDTLLITHVSNIAPIN